MLATSEKSPALDGLVMLGILMLFMRHASYGFFMINVILNNSYDPFLTIAGVDFYPLWVNGWVGIDMMFVICGYGVARMWSGEALAYKKYLVDQAWRFLPLYYLVLLLCYTAIPFFILPKPTDAWSVFYHLIFMPDVFEPGVNVAFAAVAAEIKFIIFLPFILLLASRGKKSLLVLGVFSALAVIGGFIARRAGFSDFHPTGDMIHDYYSFFLSSRFAFFYCLDPLVMGMAVAVLEKWLRGGKAGRFAGLGSRNIARLSFWLGFSALLAWLASVEQLRVITRFDATWQPLLTAVVMMLMVYGAVMGGAPRWCEGAVARHTAKLAYPIYLIHIPVIQLSFVLVSLGIYPLIPKAGLGMQFWCFCAVYTIVTYTASVLLYYGVEILFSRKKTFEP